MSSDKQQPAVVPSGPAEPEIPEFIRNHHAWYRLEDQLGWFDRKSAHCQRCYKRIKLLQVTLAVSVTLTPLVPAPLSTWWAAGSGAMIAILEAVQEMNQYSTLWVTYRTTAEKLRLERYLFLSQVGPYRGIANDQERIRLLAERVEAQLSEERSGWLVESASRVEKQGAQEQGAPA